ncbi:type II toxin-antitoxin system HicB family antitoxin [Candidatus Poribacteria bacterium]|jgi:predicted RNase H-like HicB family nuclease|nr:type II toxin-antitoxin system HicB family antitoxin [Candidatus Poribacteria bacterium]MBT5532616.1 type II toxin-antitoxin system HicB family antitoxin [Candidatus Poribacteria bacterium]MBT7095949.1 type II toxin-antitoxin system HicB family antitoxin [Candidatus Poribacteria bacterium]MBT7806268.1 type II toxin-antitoxin system HicB family antitoxin [Candidatus Poribacteria bacterium]
MPQRHTRVPIILTADEDGGFVVESPTMPGCISQGDTVEEALENIRDVIDGWVRVQRDHGHPTAFEQTDEFRWLDVMV